MTDSGAALPDLLSSISLTGQFAAVDEVLTGRENLTLVAMSLIGAPPVIFLDEPTTGLDPQARLEVWQAVRELAGRGTTILLTSQHLDEAEHGWTTASPSGTTAGQPCFRRTSRMA